MYRLGARIFKRLIYSDQGAQFQKFTLSPGGIKSKFYPIIILPLLVFYHQVKYYGSQLKTVEEIALFRERSLFPEK